MWLTYVEMLEVKPVHLKQHVSVGLLPIKILNMDQLLLHLKFYLNVGHQRKIIHTKEKKTCLENFRAWFSC